MALFRSDGSWDSSGQRMILVLRDPVHLDSRSWHTGIPVGSGLVRR
jgi:hypothetical protein